MSKSEIPKNQLVMMTYGEISKLRDAKEDLEILYRILDILKLPSELLQHLEESEYSAKEGESWRNYIKRTRKVYKKLYKDL